MPSRSDSPSEREQRLQAVLVAFLEASERGPEPDAQEWLTRHPDLAGELAEFFANRAQLDRLASPLRQLAEAAQAEADARRTRDGADANAPAAAAPGDKVRYFGDYELLEEIARGGMGVVFKARAAEPQPHRGPEDDPQGRAGHVRRTCSASGPKRRRRPTWIIRTSCRSTRSANTRGSITSA